MRLDSIYSLYLPPMYVMTNEKAGLGHTYMMLSKGEMDGIGRRGKRGGPSVC